MVLGPISLPKLGSFNLGSIFGGNASQNAGPKIIGRFTKALSHADLWDTALETSANSILCTAGLWVMIARYKVSPRQRVHFGFGSAQTPDNQGYAYLALYDDTATNSVVEDGQIRLIQMSADSLLRIPVGEWNTRDLRGDVNDRNKKIALPEQIQFDFVAEDSYLAIEFKAEATDTIVKTAIGTAAGYDIWSIPVTIETKQSV